MSESIDLVSAALVAAQAEFKPAPFDSNNPFFHSRYASFVSVLEASQAILAKHGLALLRRPGTELDASGKLWTVVETVIVHKSGQQLPAGLVRVPLELEKGRSLVQSWGAAVTYIGRYAWTTPLGIASDEDTDGNEPQGHQERATPRKATTPQAPPPDAPQANPEPTKAIPEATPAFRMRALHRLKAAPGEPNRPVVSHFLTVRGWIKGDQHPEDWDLAHVPKTLPELTALSAEIQQFGEEQMRLQTPPE